MPGPVGTAPCEKNYGLPRPARAKKYTKNDEAWLTTTNDDAGFIQQLIWKEEYIIVSSVYGIFFASTFSVEFHELVVYIK